MQRHGYVEVKGEVVAHADREEHEDEVEVVLQSDPRPLSSAFVSKHESFQSDKGELTERDEIPTAWVMPRGRGVR